MPQSIPCPLCAGAIPVAGTPPGRYRIACPRCSQSVTIEVPGEPTSAAGTPDGPDPSDTAPPPRWVAGFRVGGRLARAGAMAVYRARRLADGREVALALMSPRRSADPAFVGRWAREAYAASRIRHPNLATVRELGVGRGRPYVASEPAGGADPGRPDRAATVARWLHAARALKLAHDQGVFHRQLSAESLVDDGRGVPRLTGLGIGLTPAMAPIPAFAPVAVPGVAPGPDDPADPAVIAARADVAALGRALRAAVGGDAGRALPPGLASVLGRIADPGSAEATPRLAEVIAALEEELGVAGPFAAHDEEAHAWEETAQAFADAPLARLRPLLAGGLWGGVALLSLILLIAGRPVAAAGLVGFAATVGAVVAAIRGWFGPEPLVERARAWVLGGDRRDALTLAAGLLLGLVVLAAVHRIGTAVAWVVLASALAAAYHFAFDQPLAQSRAAALDRARAIVAGLRRLGVAEDDVRRFAARQAGRTWEELYEAVFGYDALRDARDRWGRDAGGARRPRFAAWRDPIADLLARRLDARRAAGERGWLQRVEEQAREARGVNLLTARRHAHRAAEAMAQVAGDYDRSGGEGLGRPLLRALTDAAERPDAFLASTWSDEARAEPSAPVALVRSLGSALVGPHARFLVGAALLAGSFVWMDQNGIISGRDLHEGARTWIAEPKPLPGANDLARKLADGVQGAAQAARGREARPLALSFLPARLLEPASGLGLGVAGLVLVASSLVGGGRMALFAGPAALVAVFGPALAGAATRPMAPGSLACQAAAAALGVVGLALGRGRS